jgi:FtsZ-binding cell division protein ZapB
MISDSPLIKRAAITTLQQKVSELEKKNQEVQHECRRSGTAAENAKVENDAAAAMTSDMTAQMGTLTHGTE